MSWRACVAAVALIPVATPALADDDSGSSDAGAADGSGDSASTDGAVLDAGTEAGSDATLEAAVDSGAPDGDALDGADEAEAHALPSTCSVDDDCPIGGSVCTHGFCSLLQTYWMFPDEQGLAEIALVSPANLAAASSTPSFVWSPYGGAGVAAAAVFKAEPRFDPVAGTLVNVEDIVWLWESALPGASPTDSQVVWQNGRGVQASGPGALESSALTSDAPPPLSPGIYYWGSWAWSGQDFSLAFRSKILTFVVHHDNITGTSCDANCPGTAATRCASASYCLIACASKLDCYQNYTCDLTRVTSDNPWGVCQGPDISCPCASAGATCDDELGLCYPGGNGASPSPAGCGCKATGAGSTDKRALASSILAVLLLVGIAGRRAARAPGR